MKSKMRGYMQASDIEEALRALLENDVYRTVAGYSIDSETYPNNEVPFIESHINYLDKHPQVDPTHYLSNLRLMLKIR